MSEIETDSTKNDEVDSASQQQEEEKMDVEGSSEGTVDKVKSTKDGECHENTVHEKGDSLEKGEHSKITGDVGSTTKEGVSQTATVSDNESVGENDRSQIDEDGMDSTLDTTADETEDSLVIDEDDIVKPTDVFGRGKRPKKKKKSEDYLEFHDGTVEKEGKRQGFGVGRVAGGKMINNVSATESKENTKDLQDLSRYVKRKDLPQEQLDLLQVPFEHGWRREVVIRNTVDHSNKNSSKADVYYHPPKGRKLRSMVEIVKYLVMTNSELTQDNFSFLRNAILQPPFEVVRYAGGSKGVSTKSVASPAQGRKKMKDRPEVYIDRDEDFSDQGSYSDFDKTALDATFEKTPSGVKDELYTPDTEKRKRGRPPKIVIGQKRKRDSSSPRTVEVIKQESDDLMMDVFPTDSISPTSVETVRKISSAEETVKKVSSTVETLKKASPTTTETPTSSKKYKPTARKSTTQKPSKTSPQNGGSPQISQTTPKSLCNLSCPGRNMAPPTLQCEACQCLFHPECVAFNSSIFPFVCNGCVLLSCESSSVPKTQATSASKGKPVLLPIASVMQQDAIPIVVTSNYTSSMMNIVQTGPVPSIHVPSTQLPLVKPHWKKPVPHISQETLGHLKSVIGKTKFPSSNTTTNPTLVQSLSAPPLSAAPMIAQPMPSLIPNPAVVPKFSSISPTGITNSITNQGVRTTSHVTTNPTLPKASDMKPPKLTAAPHVSPAKVNATPTIVATTSPATSMVQTPPTNGIDMNQAAKNGQLLTLPAAVVKRLNLDQPLALKINNMQITVPSSCFLQTSEGLKVFLPPKTFPVQIGETAKLSVTVTNDKSVSNNTSISVKIGDECAKASASKQKKEKKKPAVNSVEKKERRTTCARSGVNPGQCFIKRLYGGADCMLEIFRYLNMSDLARVSMVCRAWRTISMHPCLWREVKFRGMEVRDWKKAVDFLLRRAVQCLNLKGLRHVSDRTKTWQKVVTLLPRLTSVTGVHFGQVPASVLHSLCERMPHLEVFTAKWITDFDSDKIWTEPTKLDIGKFCCLSDLRELRLRGVASLRLPPFSLGGGLDDVATLDKLSVLSLTSLQDVPEEEFYFLSKMTKLEVLELGNCNKLTIKTYSMLGELVNLKTLRLEDGDNTEDCGLAEALAKLKRLETLELIMFMIDNSLLDSLSILTHSGSLKSLTLWPDTCSINPAEVNSTTLSIVSKLDKLKRLKWGIVSDKNSKMNNEKESDENKQWVPFLPKDLNEPLEYKQVCTVTSDLTKILPNTYITVYKSDTVTPFEEMESSDES